MKRYHLTNDKEVLEHSFESMSDFLDYIETQPINEHVFSKSNLESAEISEVATKFTKTENFEEAVKLCRFGYFENFERFYQDKIMIEPYINFDGQELRDVHDYVGFFPDVKAYLEGNPLNMINRVSTPKSQISIYYCVGMSGASNEKVIYNRGVITLNIIESFERMGYDVDLHLFDLSKDRYYSGSQYLLIKFLMKKKGERLNPQLIYFPMCHPSFNRRLIFRLTEQTPDLAYGFEGSMGYKCSLDEMQEVLGVDDKRIIIGWADDMDVKGKNLIEDTEAMLETINKRNKQKQLKMPVFNR